VAPPTATPTDTPTFDGTPPPTGTTTRTPFPTRTPTETRTGTQTATATRTPFVAAPSVSWRQMGPALPRSWTGRMWCRSRRSRTPVCRRASRAFTARSRAARKPRSPSRQRRTASR
jgi:hypothetical protein